METLISFIKSDLGVGIAWLCTVCSCIYALLKASENKTLKFKITKLESSIKIESNQETVNQNGDKNVYTKSNAGGMNINM